MKYTIYTDGSRVGHYSDHFKKTGYAFVAIDERGTVVLDGAIGIYSWASTSNRMELNAVVESLYQMFRLLEAEDEKIGNHSFEVITDSKYVADNVARIPEWFKNGWRGSSGKIANLPLWQALKSILDTHSGINIRWVKGHDGEAGNEYVDASANSMAESVGRTFAS